MSVKIHGKEYITVAERVNALNDELGRDNYSLTTEVLNVDTIEGQALIKATLKIGEQVYTGHGYEVFASTNINKTSHVENCETSAIGRALAAAGWAGSEYASADEVVNAISNQKEFNRDIKIHFGKHKGTAIKELPDDYIAWLIKNANPDWKEFATKEHEIRKESFRQDLPF